MRSSTKTHSRARSVVGFVLLVCAVLAPAVASAEILIGNWMEGSVDGVSAGPRIYAYHQGSVELFDTTGEYDLGTYDDTVADTGTGTHIRLAGGASGGPAWWHSDWGSRRCFDISHIGAALPEHQVRLVIDTTTDVSGGLVQADGADYRAIANDGTTELDLWVESGMGTAETVVWVQLDIVSGTTPLCLYFDNPTATTVSSQAAVFTYSTPSQQYYPLYWTQTGSGVAGRVDIVSYVDNNTIIADGISYNLNAGQTATLSGITASSTIMASGPISGRGRANGTDALIPARFAGTTMVFPTNRYTQRWTIVSPTGASALVDIYNGTNVVWSGTVGATPVSPTAEVTNNRAGIIRSTNGVPIIVTHTSTVGNDAQLVPPWTGDDLYGVRSRDLKIGFETGGSVEVYYSTGTLAVESAGAGMVTSIRQSTDLDGDGTAARLSGYTGGGAVGAIQQADRDGFESTAFIPERFLDSHYYLPANADYIAFACPTQMTINVGGVPYPCNQVGSSFPGHAIAGSTSAGTHIYSQSGEPFFAYFESSNFDDETNLFGMKSAWRWEPDPLVVTEVTATPAPSSGTWTSPVIDTTTDSTNVFGLLSMVADIPDGATVTAQIARGDTAAAALAANFVGPDGTSATSFDPVHTPIPHSWDFASPYYVIRLTLTSGTGGQSPTVDSVSLGYDLPEVHQSSTHTIATTADTDVDWVLRIWTEDPLLTGGTANVTLTATTGVSAADSATAALASTDQFIIDAGTVTQWSGPGVGIGPGLPQSLAITTDGMAATSLDAVWQARLTAPTALIPHQIHIDFS